MMLMGLLMCNLQACAFGFPSHLEHADVMSIESAILCDVSVQWRPDHDIRAYAFSHCM